MLESDAAEIIDVMDGCTVQLGGTIIISVLDSMTVYFKYLEALINYQLNPSYGLDAQSITEMPHHW